VEKRALASFTNAPLHSLEAFYSLTHACPNRWQSCAWQCCCTGPCTCQRSPGPLESRQRHLSIHQYAKHLQRCTTSGILQVCCRFALTHKQPTLFACITAGEQCSVKWSHKLHAALIGKELDHLVVCARVLRSHQQRTPAHADFTVASGRELVRAVHLLELRDTDA
jgi:hypothetical protein